MYQVVEIVVFLAGFIIIAVASHRIAKEFPRFRLPVITGLLIVGILSGPHVLDLISHESVKGLGFVKKLALAFIAFAAGSELYLNEMRSRFRSIRWMTSMQIMVTFVVGTLVIFLLGDSIPFLEPFSFWGKLMVSMLAATIFIVPAPPAAIAVVNELRARGPFTQTLMGVTVVKEFIVVIIFSIVFSITASVIDQTSFNLQLILLLGVEILVAFVLGFILGKLLPFVLGIHLPATSKSVMVVLLGFGVFEFTDYLSVWIQELTGWHLYFEPLLVCIIGSFMVTNYSRYRKEFLKIINDAATPIYAVFFTLIGASMQLNVLADFAVIILLMVCLRAVTLIIGSLLGGSLGGDSMKFNLVSWMPHIPQAGIGIGLTSLVGSQFPGWGEDFSMLMFGVILISLVIGPPMLKWSIQHVGEAHGKARVAEFDGTRDAIIFGLENQSVALARQLQKHGWNVKIATRRKKLQDEEVSSDVHIHQIEDLNLEALKELGAERAEAIVCLNADGENYKICELAYENFGVKDMIVRLNDRENLDRFHELGCLIVEPSTAIVSLMDHLVRSPQATSLLLGMEENQDTIDIEVLNPDIHGLALRDLRLPTDILVLSNKRAGQMIISTGYTRLRMHDILTLVGSVKSLEVVRRKIEG